jgi:hypothetical protein
MTKPLGKGLDVEALPPEDQRENLIQWLYAIVQCDDKDSSPLVRANRLAAARLLVEMEVL